MGSGIGGIEKKVEPCFEIFGREDSSHQVGFVERGRKEIFAGGLVLRGVIAIVHVVLSRSFLDGMGKFEVAHRASVVEGLA